MLDVVVRNIQSVINLNNPFNSFAHGRHPTHAAAYTQSQTYKQKMTQAHCWARDKKKRKDSRDNGATERVDFTITIIIVPIIVVIFVFEQTVGL